MVSALGGADHSGRVCCMLHNKFSAQDTVKGRAIGAEEIN